MSDRLFCFGLGFSALALAALVRDRGLSVAGTVRTPEKADRLRAQGIEALVEGCDDVAIAADIDLADYILSSVPPDDQGDPVLRQHKARLATAQARWIGYLSTTGVYGDHGGDWVDETTARTPTGTRGERRVAAEDGWLSLWQDHGRPIHLFRLAGIYGPGRSVIDQLRAGTAKRIDKPDHAFSRIHVDDIAAVLLASMDRAAPGEAYNVCDDAPAPSAEVTAFAAELLGMAPPPLFPFDQAELSPMARSFYRDNKKVRNDKIKRDLGVTLAYPSYREGLAACLAD